MQPCRVQSSLAFGAPIFPAVHRRRLLPGTQRSSPAFHFEKWQTYSKVARISTLNTHTFHPLACLWITQPVLRSAHSGTGPLPSFPLFSLSLRVRCISCHPLYAAKHLLWTRTSSYINRTTVTHSGCFTINDAAALS